MTPTEAFQRARDVLQHNPTDLERARAEFSWPMLDDFNWALDWFDVLAKGNDAPALILVDDRVGKVQTASFATLSERSTRLARYLTEVMRTNVMPLWETMLAAMKIGAA